MLSHLRALVPGQRSAQLVRQGRDGGSDCVADTLGTVPGQGRSVLDSRLAVIFHAGQVQEHGEARVRSTSTPIAELFKPRIRSPSQCPGTARSSISAGRSLIMISGLTNFL